MALDSFLLKNINPEFWLRMGLWEMATRDSKNNKSS